MTVRTGVEGPPIQAVNMNADVLRQFMAAMIPNPGVVGAGDYLVSALGTPNLSVNVAGGFAFVAGTQNAPSQGVYGPIYNDAIVNLVIAAANATNPRIDLVVLQVQDAAFSGGVNAPSLAVVTGTPAASPAVPTAPANSITLAQISVPAGQATITAGLITDKRSTVGGLLAMPASGTIFGAGSQGIPGATTTALSLTSSMNLRGGMTASGTQLNIPITGIYDIYGQVTYNSISSNGAVIQGVVLKNGGAVSYPSVWAALPNVNQTIAPALVGQIACSAGDSLQLATWQNTAGAQNVGLGGCFLTASLRSR